MTLVDQSVAPPTRPHTTQVVIENIGTCNMRCTYCFPEHMWQREGRHGAMPEDIYHGALERVFSTTSAPEVDVHIAGGEPLLAGRKWLDHAFGVARQIADRHGKGVTFSLQTNATLVTPEIADFLAEHNVTVGVSIDGSEEINEAARGETTRTLAGFQRLSEAFGQPAGVIVTVTRSNALRMREVIEYLESLGVLLFRANLMGATASWNADAAPRAEEWLVARQQVFEEIAARRGRIMEVNVSNSVRKLVDALLEGASPFAADNGCCGMRCPAGEGLMYFDQSGSAYPCPRANVTASARIGNWADADFDSRWWEARLGLDEAMAVPAECAACPAQLVCDYGCHAFNVAQGNFFEVNCDASKGFLPWVAGRLDDVARIYSYIGWREMLRDEEPQARREAGRGGIDLPLPLVQGLAGTLREKLDSRLRSEGLRSELLTTRYGWRDDYVPVTLVRRTVGGRKVRHQADGRGTDLKGGEASTTT